MKPKGGLGRGLAALLPVAEAQLREVDVDLIVPNPRQPREQIDPEALADLAESVRTHGILQPLIVTETGHQPGSPATYQLIAGERRWQAAKLVGLERVPVVVKEATSQQALEWALIENIQRADLGPLEEAAAFRQLIDEFHLTQEQVADRVGRSRSAVANILRLLRLPAEVKELVASGALSEGHARAVLALPDERRQAELARRAVAESWTVRRTEQEARSPSVRSAPRQPDVEWTALAGRLRDTLGAKVDLTRAKKGGRLVIYFYSDDDLTALARRLGIDD